MLPRHSMLEMSSPRVILPFAMPLSI